MFNNLKLYKKVLFFFTIIVFLVSLFLYFVLYQIKNDLITNQKQELIKTTNLVKSMTHTVLNVSIQNYLRGISETHLNTINFYFEKYKNNKITKKEALNKIKGILLNQKIGKSGYVYVLDISKGKNEITLAIHPKLEKLNVSKHNFIQKQYIKKTGYMEYNWVEEDKIKTKATYSTHFKNNDFDWIINVVPYKDELNSLIDFNPFLHELKKVQTSTIGSYVSVFGISGNIIFHPNLTGKSVLNIKDSKNGEFFIKNMIDKIKKDKKHHSGWIEYSYAKDGIDHGMASEKLLYYTYIPQYEMIVSTIVDKEHFLLPYHTLRNELIIMTLIITIIIFIITAMFSSYILNRLTNLREAAILLANNQYDINFHKTANDEIGDLEQAFEISAKKISSLIAEQNDLNTNLEEKVNQRNKQLSDFIKSTTDFLWEVDTNGVYTFVSDGSAEILGYTPEEMIGKSPFDFLIKEDSLRVKNAFVDAFKNRLPIKDVISWNITKHGKRVCLVTNGIPLFDKDGNYIGCRGADKDITNEKNKEKELIDFKNALFTESKAVMLLVNPQNGLIVDCNNKALEYYQYSYEELTQIYIHDINLLTKDEIAYEIEKAQKEKRNHFYFKHQLKNGEIRDVEVHSGPIDLKGEELLYSIIHDVTEQKEQEKIINEQAKLVSMGEMIANIAHQWRQPLSVISSGATGLILQKEFGVLKDELVLETCNTINDNAQYLSRTIDDFKNFIKGDRDEMNFNLDATLDSFINLVNGSIKKYNIHLRKDIPNDIYLRGYPNELTQCFINIFNNAKDALLDQNEYFRYIFITASIKDDKVEIIFKDSAKGIPDNVISHIFEPYFTTKHKSQGTGLGLSMTYKLINEGMNGTIEVVNEEYDYEGNDLKGAKFKISLPLS